MNNTSQDTRSQSETVPLSRRELEIAALYAQGMTSREISDALFISQTTVRNHVATIYRKLGVSRKAELQLCLDELGKKSPADVITPGSVSPVHSDHSQGHVLRNIQAQQRALNEILHVISQIPGDIDAIFDVILDHALELSHSSLGIVYTCTGDGYKATGFKNVPADFETYLTNGALHPGPATGLGRMHRQRRIIHIPDVVSENLYRQGDPLRIATVELGGARSFLAIPMLHRDKLIGAFTIYRQEVKPFAEEELTLLQAFSNQAAIALTITQLIEERNRLLKKLNEQTGSK